MSYRLMLTLLTTSYLGCCVSGVAEESLSWTPSQMMKIKGVSDVQLAPDNNSLVFVVREAKLSDGQDKYVTKLYKANINGKEQPFPFTQSESSANQPRWSPNGKWIAFLSDRSGEKNLYVIRPDGGEAIPLTQAKESVQTFRWSPDSRYIAFISADDTEPMKGQELKNDAYIYKEDKKANRLWLVDLLSPTSDPLPLTSDAYYVRGSGDFSTHNEEFDWSPDGKMITFAYSPASGCDNFHMDSSLATIELETRNITPWKKNAQHESLPRYSPDGTLIAYLSSDETATYDFTRRVIIASADGKKSTLLAETFNEGPFLRGPNLLGWAADGKHLLFFEPKGTKFHITLLPINQNAPLELATADWFFTEPSLSYDRTMLGFIAQSPDTPPEAYVTKLNAFKPVQISQINQAFLSYPKTKTETIHWQSIDGLNIEGLLTYPINYQKGKHYPLLVVVHGGPMGFFDETFLGMPYSYPLAAFAEEGFLIFRPNPRGSCGYGKTFRCANYNDWGGKDFADIMTGVDVLVNKGVADPKRMGIMGWSYGGYMTAWAITQTSRFKAASMGAGISNLISMSGTSDLNRLLPDYFQDDFWRKPEIYQERSPAYYVANVTTPCLIQHGVEDKRVPVSQSYEFYHALDRAGKEVQLILYPRMGHGFSEPKLQLDSMEKNLNWFKEHLLPRQENIRKSHKTLS